jgi:hypothetical protein
MHYNLLQQKLSSIFESIKPKGFEVYDQSLQQQHNNSGTAD